MMRIIQRNVCMLSAGKLGAFGVGENGIRNAMGIPMTPKKTDRPPQNQDRNTRPLAKIEQPDACGETKEGQTDHKTLSGEPESPHRWRKFGGIAWQLDQKQREQCDREAQKEENAAKNGH